MSDVPSIVIKFEVSIDSSLILEELLANNWSPNHSDSNVLPLGDKEMFNWVDIKNYTVGDLLDLFKNKSKVKETAGITLSWKDSGIGGEFLFIEDRQLLLFCNTAESPVIAETGAIDFSWYVNRIYRPLAKKFEVSALELSID